MGARRTKRWIGAPILGTLAFAAGLLVGGSNGEAADAKPSPPPTAPQEVIVTNDASAPIPVSGEQSRWRVFHDKIGISETSPVVYLTEKEGHDPYGGDWLRVETGEQLVIDVVSIDFMGRGTVGAINAYLAVGSDPEPDGGSSTHIPIPAPITVFSDDPPGIQFSGSVSGRWVVQPGEQVVLISDMAGWLGDDGVSDEAAFVSISGHYELYDPMPPPTP